MTEDEARQLAQTAFREGVMQARAEFSADLRQLADDFTTQVYLLRNEIRTVLGLPKLASPDERDGMLQ